MTDRQALALTLWGEARGEPIEGKIGVAMVIRNRVISHYGGAQSYADVCLAKAQFSAWTEEANQMAQAEIELAGTHIDPTLKLCDEIAAATIAGRLSDNTGGANHYLTTAMLASNAPSWARGVVGIQLGAQTFLRLA